MLRPSECGATTATTTKPKEARGEQLLQLVGAALGFSLLPLLLPLLPLLLLLRSIILLARQQLTDWRPKRARFSPQQQQQQLHPLAAGEAGANLSAVGWRKMREP